MVYQTWVHEFWFKKKEAMQFLSFFYFILFLSFTWVAISLSLKAGKMAVCMNSVMFSSEGINQPYPYSVWIASYPY